MYEQKYLKYLKKMNNFTQMKGGDIPTFNDLRRTDFLETKDPRYDFLSLINGFQLAKTKFIYNNFEYSKEIGTDGLSLDALNKFFIFNSGSSVLIDTSIFEDINKNITGCGFFMAFMYANYVVIEYGEKNARQFLDYLITKNQKKVADEIEKKISELLNNPAIKKLDDYFKIVFNEPQEIKIKKYFQVITFIFINCFQNRDNIILYYTGLNSFFEAIYTISSSIDIRFKDKEINRRIYIGAGYAMNGNIIDLKKNYEFVYPDWSFDASDKIKVSNNEDTFWRNVCNIIFLYDIYDIVFLTANEDVINFYKFFNTIEKQKKIKILPDDISNLTMKELDAPRAWSKFVMKNINFNGIVRDENYFTNCLSRFVNIRQLNSQIRRFDKSNLSKKIDDLFWINRNGTGKITLYIADYFPIVITVGSTLTIEQPDNIYDDAMRTNYLYKDLSNF